MKQGGTLYWRRKYAANEGRIVVHKSRQRLPSGIILLSNMGKWKFLCRIEYAITKVHASWYWKDVTCKRCLAKKPVSKNMKKMAKMFAESIQQSKDF